MGTIQSTKAGNAAAKPFYRLLPPYALGEGLINLASRPLQDVISGKHTNALSYNVVGRNLLYLACEAAGYYIINMCIELRVVQRAAGWCKRFVRTRIMKSIDNYDEPSEYALADEDIDVRDERIRVANNLRNKSSDDLLTVHHLRKQFPDIPICTRKSKIKVAVNDLSLSIPRKECFGFLGTNGAGMYRIELCT